MLIYSKTLTMKMNRADPLTLKYAPLLENAL